MISTSRETGDIAALDEDDGAVQPVGNDGYVTLGVDSYLFVIGGVKGVDLDSIQIVTDATIAAVFTVETCNLPRDKIEGAATVTDWDTATVGAWVKEDPPTAYVATVGTGWSVVNLTLTKTAGTGGAMLHIGNLGSRRMRLKAVVSTGGKVRVNGHGKS